MAPRPRKLSRRQKLIATAPALAVSCMTIFAASGASIVPGAVGASSVAVNGSVSTTFSTNPTVAGDCADESIGTNFKSVAAISNGCTISFSSNNGTGSRVVFDNNNAGAVDFFCADPDRVDTNADGDVLDAGESDGAAARSCATDANTIDDKTGTGNTLGTQGAGLALVSITGDAGGAAGAGVSAADATPLASDAIWAGIPDQGAAAAMCSFPGAHTTSTSCNFAFGALGKGATQGAGAYSGTLRLTAELT